MNKIYAVYYAWTISSDELCIILSAKDEEDAHDKAISKTDILDVYDGEDTIYAREMKGLTSSNEDYITIINKEISYESK